MITLGLCNLLPKRWVTTSAVPQTLSEIVAQLKPSPAVLQALSDTAAWCRCSKNAQLRSSELDPTSLLKVRPFDEIGMEAHLMQRRQSYERAVQSINSMRSNLSRDASQEIDPANPRGKLLLYEPLETVDDGASSMSSQGFFDCEDAPAWDTWFLYSAGSIFSWLPERLIANAQAGIDPNPVDCIHWCDKSKLPA